MTDYQAAAWLAKLGQYPKPHLCAADPTGENGWHLVEPLFPLSSLTRRDELASLTIEELRALSAPPVTVEDVARVIYASLHHLMGVSGVQAQTAYETAARSIIALFHTEPRTTPNPTTKEPSA